MLGVVYNILPKAVSDFVNYGSDSFELLRLAVQANVRLLDPSLTQ